MTEFVVHGVADSPYVRTVRAMFEEKQTAHTLAGLPPGIGSVRSAEHIARHPFGRIPVLEHGDFRLYETQAILRYLDAVLPGQSLTPKDCRAQARMNQLMGIVDWYLFPSISVGITAERLLSQFFWDRPASEENIAKALPQARVCLSEIARLKGSAPYLAGDEMSLADLMAATHLLFFRYTPEAKQLLHGTALDEWLLRVDARASMRATQPQLAQRAA